MFLAKIPNFWSKIHPKIPKSGSTVLAYEEARVSAEFADLKAVLSSLLGLMENENDPLFCGPVRTPKMGV